MEPREPAPGGATDVPRGTPRWRRVVAFLATLLFPGISQADDGEFRRGLLWYLGLNASLLAGLLLAYAAIGKPWLSMGIVAAILAAGIGLTLRLAIDGYRRERTPARRGSTNRLLSIYAAFLFAGLAFGFAKDGIGEYLVATYRIPSISMEPTLMRGDFMVVDKSAYRHGRHPRAGDIAIFIFPEDREKTFVKRIVAVPGDTVEIRRSKLRVNGKEIPEGPAEVVGSGDAGVADNNKGPSAFLADMAPVRLADGKYFMLGDNRRRSYDSRHFGPVDEDDFLGKAAYVYFSRDLGRVGKTIR